MKNGSLKRVISAIMILALLLSTLPIGASAHYYYEYYYSTTIVPRASSIGNDYYDQYYFEGFSKAYFPKSITTIYGDFFCYNYYEDQEDYYHYDLSTIYYEGTWDDWDNINFEEQTYYNIFDRVYTECKIYDRYIYTVENDQITLLTYFGFENTISIPDYIDGLPVTKLCDTFESNTNITTVTIPKTVKKLEGKVFNYCTKLQTINFDGSLNYVSEKAFDNSAYYKKSANWKDNALYFGNWLIKYNGTKTKFTVADGTLGICKNAFASNTSLVDVRLPSGLKYIEQNAFRYCSNLRSLYLPKSITRIGDSALYDTKKLKYILYEGSVTLFLGVDIDLNYNGSFTSENMYYNYTPLDNDLDYVMIDNKVNAFNYFGNDDNVIVPPEVNSIKEYTFYGCNFIKSITLYDTLDSVSNTAFTDCTGIKTVYFYGSSEKWESLGINIPSSYELIFNPNTPLDNIGYVIDSESNSIKITSYTGSNEHVVIPSSYMGYPVKFIDENAFANNTSIKTLTIYGTDLEIGDNAFDGCTALETVVINDGIYCIWAEAFKGCTALKTVVLPSSLSFIGYKAFYGCNNIASVVFIGSESVWNAISEEIDRGNDKLLNATVKFATVADGIIFVSATSKDPDSIITVSESDIFVYGCDLEKSTCIEIHGVSENDVTALVPTYDKFGKPVSIYDLENGNATDVAFTQTGNYIECSDLSSGKYFVCTYIGIPGDSNNDGSLNSLDSNLLKRKIAGELSDQKEEFLYDTNSDGEINAIDSNLLRRKIAGM